MRCPSCNVLLSYSDGIWEHAQQPSPLCIYPTPWIGDPARLTLDLDEDESFRPGNPADYGDR